MWQRIFLLSCFVLVCASCLAADAGPFSHKKHAPLKQKCAECHNGTAEAARFPASDKCKVCHTETDTGKIPSKRVYLLPDFISFSHAKHKVECSTCHGDVAAKDVLAVERPLKMFSCVGCHRDNHATVRCNVCHELGR